MKFYFLSWGEQVRGTIKTYSLIKAQTLFRHARALRALPLGLPWKRSPLAIRSVLSGLRNREGESVISGSFKTSSIPTIS